MKLACFLKVKQKLTGRGCQNHATVRGLKHVLRDGKNCSYKMSAIKTKDLSISCLLKKSASILIWSKQAEVVAV